MRISSYVKSFVRYRFNKYIEAKGLMLVQQEDLCSYSDLPYIERDEYGASNLQTKLENVKRGEPFEYPDIINLNIAVSLLSKDYSRIVELGSGTGKYVEMMSARPGKYVVGCEHDEETHQWCLHNFSDSSNKRYLKREDPLEYGPYDLSVAIEVVEHIKDYPSFLKLLGRLADTSIITTPNRSRSAADNHSGPPNYFKHVREWSAGEFYWVLRSFWRSVDLYAVPSDQLPEVRRVSVDTRLSPLIAICNSPISE
jgi:2-polyprenyl-3-methyl-5-hydroxy-6-metoxy-1,4-benzoquinol methylase